MNTLTRQQLTEELAIAETNYQIASDKMERIHTDYLLAVDLVQYGDAAPGTADLIYADFEVASRHKTNCWHKVDALKAQLLERDEIAAALDEVKASLTVDRMERFSDFEKAYRWKNGDGNQEATNAWNIATVVLARQIVAHI